MTNKILRAQWLVILAAFISAGCATNVAIPTNSLTPLDLMASQEKYNDTIVLVRGRLFIDRDVICLIDPSHAHSENPPNDALFSILGLDLISPKFEKYDGKEIALYARFKSKLTSESQFLLKGCTSSGVRIETAQTPMVTDSKRVKAIKGDGVE